MPDTTSPAVSMETLVALCKRRGFIFPSSEIYGGINGFFDYGPLGAELKKNIRDCWWDDMVRRRDDIVGIETSIIMHPKVWEASGHVAGFTDPLVDCKASKQRYRADQLFFAPVVVDGATVGYVSALESERTAEDLQEAAEGLKRKRAIQGKLEPVHPRDMTEAGPEEIALIPSPATVKAMRVYVLVPNSRIAIHPVQVSRIQPTIHSTHRRQVPSERITIPESLSISSLIPQ